MWNHAESDFFTIKKLSSHDNDGMPVFERLIHKMGQCALCVRVSSHSPVMFIDDSAFDDDAEVTHAAVLLFNVTNERAPQ